MHTQHPHIALPLEQFFAQLHAAGFRTDTGRKLRLLQALKQHGAAHIGRMQDLKYALAPFVASSPEEQRRFYEFFDAFLRECGLEADQWAAGGLPDLAPTEAEKPIAPPPPGFWKKYQRWLIALPILLAAWLAAPYLKNWLSRPPAPLPPARIEYASLDDNIRREGQQKPFRNATADIHPDSCRWEVRDAKTGVLEHSDTALHLDWTARGYGRSKKVILDAGTRGKDSMLVEIHCANPPAMPQWAAPESPLVQGQEYEFTVDPKEKNARVQWYLKEHIGNIYQDTTIFGVKVRYSFDGNGPATVTCKVYFNEKDCYVEEERPFRVGTDKPILPLAGLQYDTPRTETRLKIWVWLLFLLPLLPAAWCFRRWRQKRRERPAPKTDDELAEKYPLHDKAPYLIPYLPQDGKITTPPDFFRMADVLRRREHSERREVDVPASLRATVDCGGFPTLLDRRDTTPPDYLFLIERPSPQDQQGRLFERLTSFFRRQDAPLTVFFHDGNYRSFWSDEKPGGVSFDFLQKQYAGYRLVLIGTGQALSNPYDTRLPALRRAPMEALLFWKKALFLSSLPLSGWAAPEVLLHRHFLLFPADTEGIRAGLEALDALEEHEPGPYTKWEETLAKRRHDPNPRFRLWDTVEQHRDFFTRRSFNEGRPQPSSNQQPTTNNQEPTTDFKWLCGLAASVLPDFALTVAIGKKMGVEVTHDGLLRLSRIPWLNQNEPDPRLRLALLAQLDPDEERLARQAVAEELEALRDSVAGGYAELDWKTNLAIHRFALDPYDPEHRQTLRELMQLGLLSESQLMELDGIVQRRLEPRIVGATSSHPDNAPAGTRFSEYLDKKPFFTQNMLWALLLTALSLGLLAWGWQQQRQWQQQAAPPASAFVRQHEVIDSALIWHNEALRLAEAVNKQSDYFAWEKGGLDTARMAEQLFERAIAARSPAAYALADSNARRFRGNLNAQRFNFFLAGAPFDLVRSKMAFNEPLAETAVVEANFQFLKTTDSAFLRQSEILAKDYDAEVRLAALHGHGLCQFYLSKNSQNPAHLDTAKTVCADLLAATDSLYFDTLRARMPVNLQTLLFGDQTPNAQPGQCRTVANVGYALTLRSRVLSQPEYTETERNPNGPLDRQTYLAAIPRGETVVLLDSIKLAYKITYKGKTGYVAIFFNNKPTLLPCGGTPRPPARDTSRATALILADINRSMTLIRGGSFRMGSDDNDKEASDDEKPAHDVTLSDYYIGATEVTIEQYLIFCDKTKTHYPEWLEPGSEYNIETGTNDYYKQRGMSRENKKYPITGISWDDAVAYCAWLSTLTGRQYRLPSEAEWEYAARGGTSWKDGFTYAGSNNIDEVAWYSDNSGSQSHPVGGKKPNQRGLYDMSGNVWEWCQDAWHENYQGAPTDGRAWMEGGSAGTAVLRGGSWLNYASFCRPALRLRYVRYFRLNNFGFRLARAASAGGR